MDSENCPSASASKACRRLTSSLTIASVYIRFIRKLQKYNKSNKTRLKSVTGQHSYQVYMNAFDCRIVCTTTPASAPTNGTVVVAIGNQITVALNLLFMITVRSAARLNPLTPTVAIWVQL